MLAHHRVPIRKYRYWLAAMSHSRHGRPIVKWLGVSPLPTGLDASPSQDLRFEMYHYALSLMVQFHLGNFSSIMTISILSRQFQFNCGNLNFLYGNFSFITANWILSRQFKFRPRQSHFFMANSISSRQFQLSLMATSAESQILHATQPWIFVYHKYENVMDLRVYKAFHCCLSVRELCLLSVVNQPPGFVASTAR